MKFNAHTINSYSLSLQKKDVTNINPGDTVEVSEKILEGKKSRIQKFQGIIISKKHKNTISCNILVRKKLDNVYVEKRFFIYSPTIEEIKVENKGYPRRAVLSYLRNPKNLSQKLKRLRKP